MSELKKGITNKTSFSGKDIRSCNLPTKATRTPSHVKATNTTAKYLKGKPSHGTLGARGHDV